MNKKGVSIIYKYNEREITGIEEFKKEIESSYSAQGLEMHLPACSEGGEFILKILLETDWNSFVKGAVASGLLWDGIKIAGQSFVLKPLFDALDKLFDRNRDGYGLKLVSTSFLLEDRIIVIYGLSDNYKTELDTILHKISTRAEQIEEEYGDNSIIDTIEFPYYYEKENDRYLEDSYIEPFGNPHFMKVVFKDGSCRYEVIGF